MAGCAGRVPAPGRRSFDNGGRHSRPYGARHSGLIIMALRIGNACGFWGDAPDAPARLVAQAPDLDYLTLDYLAEVSMSILARQRERRPALGYPADFIEVVRSLAPRWSEGRRFRVVTNAGGLNPADCAGAAADVLRDAGCGGL